MESDTTKESKSIKRTIDLAPDVVEMLSKVKGGGSLQDKANQLLRESLFTSGFNKKLFVLGLILFASLILIKVIEQILKA